ncbi:alpha/beta hydrolase [Geodermatophilus sp. YIM 151500]|uniref:alpha/beta fold hydrolase n=1 Tax=Geodermatophilus sp. YIM 151500 TaxID=2984531 RepID=UPI0021E3B774|nr:alpha/beta hydrolase [Geodermatophilus sp. YIM 151500]MCV2490044.1 alpha/beta hydrolase [Geodermatophilus sp. YIM 151500]
MTTIAAPPSAAPAYVTSSDGTRIGYWRSGSGPPLVMVHGGMADHTTLARVVPLLESRLTVYAVDRRGRGASGDGRNHAIEREYDDIAAVVDAAARDSGGTVALFGHSFGATCALGAVLRAPDVGRLILYEPAFRGVFDYPAGLLDRITALVAAGRADEALAAAFLERVGVSAAELDALRALPSWTARIGSAATVPRELRLDATLAFDPAPYTTCTTPTRLLLGEASPAGQRSVVRSIASALPGGRIVVLPGQGHMAQATAPELVANAVIPFITEPAGA